MMFGCRWFRSWLSNARVSALDIRPEPNLDSHRNTANALIISAPKLRCGFSMLKLETWYRIYDPEDRKSCTTLVQNMFHCCEGKSRQGRGSGSVKFPFISLPRKRSLSRLPSTHLSATLELSSRTPCHTETTTQVSSLCGCTYQALDDTYNHNLAATSNDSISRSGFRAIRRESVEGLLG